MDKISVIVELGAMVQGWALASQGCSMIGVTKILARSNCIICDIQQMHFIYNLSLHA
jgi:hypothetical protein